MVEDETDHGFFFNSKVLFDLLSDPGTYLLLNHIVMLNRRIVDLACEALVARLLLLHKANVNCLAGFQNLLLKLFFRLFTHLDLLGSFLLGLVLSFFIVFFTRVSTLLA